MLLHRSILLDPHTKVLCYRDQYSEILMQKWVGVFNKIFDEDNYTPIMVETDDEYEVIISKFPFRDEQLEQVGG